MSTSALMVMRFIKTSYLIRNVQERKPEYEDLKKIVKQLNLPLNKVREEVLTQLGGPARDV